MMIKALCIFFVLFALAGCLTPDSAGLGTGDPNAILLTMLDGLPTVDFAGRTEIAISPAVKIPAIRIQTSHYNIYTTVTDRLILRRLPMLLESAWQNFQVFMPGADQDQVRRGEVYYFREREQWLAFTRVFAAENAEVFSQIRSGAYCYKNVCVAWQISRQADFSVLAHEAWHQYCGLNFKESLPSWLAESSAVYLESYKWAADGLVFSPKYNSNRLAALKLSMAAGVNFSIAQLVSSDPGEVISQTAAMTQDKSELFLSGYYARLYALSRFCFEYEYGIYRKDYLSIFDAAYAGRLVLPEPLKNADEKWKNTRLWNIQAGSFLFEHYFGENKVLIEEQYQSYCAKLAGSVRIVR